MATKKKGIRWYTKKADELFSRVVRMRAAGPDGFVACVTCGTVKHYKDGMHAGHFVDRKWMGTRWDDANVHPQCVRCNTFHAGEGPEYFRWMQEHYGEEVIDDLREKRNRKWTVGELMELVDSLKIEVKELEREVL